MLKIQINEATICQPESVGSGYMTVKTSTNNNEDYWIELHGNEENSDYPLCFASNREIDEFAAKLKVILKSVK